MSHPKCETFDDQHPVLRIISFSSWLCFDLGIESRSIDIAINGQIIECEFIAAPLYSAFAFKSYRDIVQGSRWGLRILLAGDLYDSVPVGGWPL